MYSDNDFRKYSELYHASKYPGGFVNGKNTSAYNAAYYQANKWRWGVDASNAQKELDKLLAQDTSHMSSEAKAAYDKKVAELQKNVRTAQQRQLASERTSKYYADKTASDIKNTAKNAVGTVTNAGRAVANVGRNIVNTATNAVKGATGNSAKEVANNPYASSAAQEAARRSYNKSVQGTVDRGVETVKRTGAEAKAAANNAYEGAKRLGTNAVNTVKGLPTAIANTAKGRTGYSAKEVANNPYASSAAQEAARKSYENSAARTIDRGVENVTKAANQAKDTVSTAANAAKGEVASAAKKVTDTIKDIPSNVSNAVSAYSAYRDLEKAQRDYDKYAKASNPTSTQIVEKNLREAEKRFNDAISKPGAKLGTDVADTMDRAKNQAVTARNMFQNQAGTVKNMPTNQSAVAQLAISNAMSEAIESARNAYNDVVERYGWNSPQAQDARKDLIADATQAFNTAVEPIKNRFSSVEGTVSGAIEDGQEWINNLLGSFTEPKKKSE